MGAKQTIKKTTTVTFKANKNVNNSGVHRCPNCGKYMKGKSNVKSGTKG